MSFRLHHSITLDCELSRAQSILLDPDNFVQLQEIAPSCKDCQILKKANNEAALTLSSTITKDSLIQDLSSNELPRNLPWPPLKPDDETQSHATYFKFSEMGSAEVSGSQITAIDLNAVFFHSHVPSAGIEEYKLRLLEVIGDNKVKVTETVWGTAPWWLASLLKITGLAQKTHVKHMRLYHKLV